MTENQVEKAVVQFMQRLGWRATRNHVGVFTQGGRIVTIGTPGFPDWTFTRPLQLVQIRGRLELLHFEAKAPGKKPSAKQFEVMAALGHLGELAVWADTLESFQNVYYMNFPADEGR